MRLSKRCSRKSEVGGGAMCPSDDPIGGTKRRDDVCTLGIRQSPDASRPPHFSRSHSQLVRRSTTQDGSGRHDDAALNDILQLPDISRPVVLFQREHQFLRDLIDCFALLFREPTDEMFRQQPDISSPFAERRNGDRKHVQAVIEVGAESLLFHHTAQVLIRRGDDPHVGVQGMAAAQALELLFLEDPEKLRLQFQWKIADLVQEKRAPVGGLEPSDGLRHSAGECAPFATEELALQQGFGIAAQLSATKRFLYRGLPS